MHFNTSVIGHHRDRGCVNYDLYFVLRSCRVIFQPLCPDDFIQHDSRCAGRCLACPVLRDRDIKLLILIFKVNHILLICLIDRTCDSQSILVDLKSGFRGDRCPIKGVISFCRFCYGKLTAYRQVDKAKVP